MSPLFIRPSVHLQVSLLPSQSGPGQPFSADDSSGPSHLMTALPSLSCRLSITRVTRVLRWFQARGRGAHPLSCHHCGHTSSLAAGCVARGVSTLDPRAAWTPTFVHVDTTIERPPGVVNARPQRQSQRAQPLLVISDRNPVCPSTSASPSFPRCYRVVSTTSRRGSTASVDTVVS